MRRIFVGGPGLEQVYFNWYFRLSVSCGWQDHASIICCSPASLTTLGTPPEANEYSFLNQIYILSYICVFALGHKKKLIISDNSIVNLNHKPKEEIKQNYVCFSSPKFTTSIKLAQLFHPPKSPFYHLSKRKSNNHILRYYKNREMILKNSTW